METLHKDDSYRISAGTPTSGVSAWAGHRQELIKKTRSLCPVCTRVTDADIIEDDGKIWLERTCPAHGTTRYLLCRMPPSITGSTATIHRERVSKIRR